MKCVAQIPYPIAAPAIAIQIRRVLRLRRDRAMKDIDGDNARDETNQAGEQNKPPVVFPVRQRKNAEHLTRL